MGAEGEYESEKLNSYSGQDKHGARRAHREQHKGAHHNCKSREKQKKSRSFHERLPVENFAGYLRVSRNKEQQREDDNWNQRERNVQ